LGLTDQARPLLEKSLALRRQSRSNEDGPEVAATLHSLGWLYHQTGDYPKARRFYEESLAIREKYATADPLALSTTLLTLGWLLADLEEFAPAEEKFRQALDIRLRHLGPDHRDTAVARAGIVAAYIAQGKIAKAIMPYQQAMATLRKTDTGKGLISSIGLFQQAELARHLPEIARFPLLGLKDDEAVEKCFYRSLDLAREALGSEHVYVTLVLHELATTLADHKKDEPAERYFRDCLRNARLYGLDHPKTNILLSNFCSFLKRRGKQAEAEQLLEEAIHVRQRRHSLRHFLVADILVIRATTLEKDSTSNHRRELLREALAIYCESPGGTRSLVSACVRELARDLSATESYDLACTLAFAAKTRDEHSVERTTFLDLALTVLRSSLKKGLRDAERMQHDRNLDTLRGRDDFKKLIVEADSKAKR
jgi:tetratricopeptide (TPR) repeat protein